MGLKHHGRRRACVLVLLVLFPCLTFAELQPCISESDDLKIFADGMHVATTVDLGEHPGLGRLQVLIDNMVRAIRNLASDLEFTVVRCEDRKPRGISDFDEQLIGDLFDDGVVLEVWGRIDIDEVEGNFQPVAQVSFLVVPLRRVEASMTSTALKGYYWVDYSTTVENEDQLQESLMRSEEIESFSALSVGLKQLGGQELDKAVASLCEAHGRLAGISDDSPLAATIDLDELRAFIAEALTEAFSRASEWSEENSVQLLDVGPEVLCGPQ